MSTSSPSVREWATSAATVALVTAAILVFFLSVYRVRGYDEPIGSDAPRYIWRTNCVASGGLAALRRCGRTPHAGLPNRVAYPVLALSLSAVFSLSRFGAAAILPVVAAATLALAAATLACAAMRLSQWAFAVLALVVGTSPVVVSMAAPESYVDMMLALAFGTGGLALTLIAIHRGSGSVAAAGLLAAALVAHWTTGVVFVVILGGVLVLSLPAIRRRWLWMGEPDLFTTGRLGLVLGLAVVLWGAALLLLVRELPDRFEYSIPALPSLFRSRFFGIGLPVAMPIAVVGWVALARKARTPGSDRAPRTFLAMLSVWIVAVSVGVAAWLAGRNVPVHRFLLLLLPIPILGAVGLLWLAAGASRWSRVAGLVVIALGCAAGATAGYVLWLRASPPKLQDERLDAASWAGRYIEAAVPAGNRVTVVADLSSVRLDFLSQTFLAATPPGRVAAIRFRRKPLTNAGTGKPGVVLVVSGYSSEFPVWSRTRPDRIVAPGVVLVRGPSPGSPLPAGPTNRVEAGLGQLILIASAALLVTAVIGMGWLLLPFATVLRPVERLAVAPALGLVTLILTGTAADRLGVRLVGLPGVLVVLGTIVVMTGAGTLAEAHRRRAAPTPCGP
jgi:hypothetical protein